MSNMLRNRPKLFNAIHSISPGCLDTLPRADTDLNRHLNEAIEMLQTGGKFSKTKRGRNRTTRLIRCSDDLRGLCWNRSVVQVLLAPVLNQMVFGFDVVITRSNSLTV